MSNEMTPFGGGLPSAESLNKALTGYRPPVLAGGKSYMKLSKGGEWVYGPEETPLEGTAVINPHTFCDGYVSWGEGEKLGEQMRFIAQGEAAIDPSTLDATGAAWQDQVGFDLIMLDGVDAGLELQYRANSLGGRKAFAELIREVGVQSDAAPETCAPVVTLSVDSYPHKKYGRVYTPEFTVVGWRLNDGTEGKKAKAKKPAAKARTRKRS